MVKLSYGPVRLHIGDNPMPLVDFIPPFGYSSAREALHWVCLRQLRKKTNLFIQHMMMDCSVNGEKSLPEKNNTDS
jgi:hypothetical protein